MLKVVVGWELVKARWSYTATMLEETHMGKTKQCGSLLKSELINQDRSTPVLKYKTKPSLRQETRHKCSHTSTTRVFTIKLEGAVPVADNLNTPRSRWHLSNLQKKECSNLLKPSTCQRLKDLTTYHHASSRKSYHLGSLKSSSFLTTQLDCRKANITAIY